MMRCVNASPSDKMASLVQGGLQTLVGLLKSLSWLSLGIVIGAHPRWVWIATMGPLVALRATLVLTCACGKLCARLSSFHGKLVGVS